MNNSILNYAIYASIFVVVVLAVEGVYLLLRASFGRDRALNRRLDLQRRTEDGKAALSLLTRAQGGPVSRALAKSFPWLATALWTARSNMSPAVFCVVTLASACAISLLSTVASPFPTLAIAPVGFFVGGFLPFVFVAMAGAKRRRRFIEQLPAAIDLTARSLQAGHPVPAAFGLVAKEMADPIGTEFGLALDEMTYGLDRDVALSNLAQRFPCPELKMFVASIQLQRETGGNLAELLIKLSDIIRAKATLRKKVWAVSAEGRISMVVVGGLPLVVVGAIMLLRPNFYLDVASDPLFVPMMAFPPVLLVIGILIMWKMINFKV